MEKEKSVLRELVGWLVYILVIVAVTGLIVTFVGQRTRVSGQSMQWPRTAGTLIICYLCWHLKFLLPIPA